AAIYQNELKTKNLAEEQKQAKEDALAYGEGLSEGTLKGVKGYKDLLDEARIKMIELKNMSGKEAENAVKEINDAFSILGDMVESELEKHSDTLTQAITKTLQVAGETGRKEDEEINKSVLKVIEEKIEAHTEAIDTRIKPQEKYG